MRKCFSALLAAACAAGASPAFAADIPALCLQGAAGCGSWPITGVASTSAVMPVVAGSATAQSVHGVSDRESRGVEHHKRHPLGLDGGRRPRVWLRAELVGCARVRLHRYRHAGEVFPSGTVCGTAPCCEPDRASTFTWPRCACNYRLCANGALLDGAGGTDPKPQGRLRTPVRRALLLERGEPFGGLRRLPLRRVALDELRERAVAQIAERLLQHQCLGLRDPRPGRSPAHERPRGRPAASSSASGTTSCTRPMRRASSALNRSPVSA